MKELRLDIYRHTYNTEGDRNIIGDLHTSESGFFCYTLEDEIRADGVKHYGITCVSAGEYDFIVSWSPHFQRMTIEILNVPRFSGIRMHGGNDSEDTLGCPLVAFNTDYTRIWGTAEKKLTELAIKHGGKGKICIHNTPFTYDKVKHEKII